MRKINMTICVIALLLQACAAKSPPTVTYSSRRRLKRVSPQSKKSRIPTQRSYTVAGKTYHPIASEKGFVQEGIASWYGDDFHGRLTSNGETYDMYAETAAHKTLPMNTYVRVTNLRNNNQIIVRINDRGPFVKGRIIDLSYAGAKRMDMLNQGTAPVRVVALGRKVVTSDKKIKFVPVDFNAGNFTVQVGAFKEKANAERLAQRLSKQYAGTHWVVFDSPQGRFYRVRAGKYDHLEKADEACRKLSNQGFPGSFIVAE